VRLLRAKLIFEEAMETIQNGLGVSIQVHSNYADLMGSINVAACPYFTIKSPFNLVETVDGCCDLKVVTTGTLSACGVPDEVFQNAVDENNLAKFGPGHYVADGTPEKPGPVGKLIKPPGHKPPDIAGLLCQLSDHCE
jgi:predicted HAD superfamily Cof-like phosphohydrolase